MGNSESNIKTTDSTKSSNTVLNKAPPTSILKSKANSISNQHTKSSPISPTPISDRIEPSNVPVYHQKPKDQVDQGVQTYHYFRPPINQDNIQGKLGIHTQRDNQYSYDVNTLYENEIKYREAIDCTHEVPYTREELDKELAENRDLYYHNTNPGIKTQGREYTEIKKTVMQPLGQPPSNIPNQIPSGRYGHIQGPSNIDNTIPTESLGITREQALEIRDFKFLTNLEKRLMIMNNITLYNLDPLGIQPNERLKLSKLIDKYTSLRNIYHPDRGGNTKMFIMVNQALESQKYIQQSKILDKDHTQLRQDFNTYNETGKKKKPINITILK
jgi:hypothetical protein